jgi:hypothetical protein
VDREDISVILITTYDVSCRCSLIFSDYIFIVPYILVFFSHVCCFRFARFLSFCRVGTGLSDEELNVLVSKLKPFFRYLLSCFFCCIFIVVVLYSCFIKARQPIDHSSRCFTPFLISHIVLFVMVRKNEYPKKAPRFYEVSNNSKERPDVWIESPDK